MSTGYDIHTNLTLEEIVEKADGAIEVKPYGKYKNYRSIEYRGVGVETEVDVSNDGTYIVHMIDRYNGGFEKLRRKIQRMFPGKFRTRYYG